MADKQNGSGNVSAAYRIADYFQPSARSGDYDLTAKTPIALSHKIVDDDRKPVKYYPLTCGPQYNTSKIAIQPYMHYQGYFAQPDPDKTAAVMITGNYGAPDSTTTEHIVIRRFLPTYAKSAESHVFDTEGDGITLLPYKRYQYPSETLPGSSYPLTAVYLYPFRSSLLYQFRGAVTSMNPENDPEKQDIIDYGLEYNDKKRNGRTLASYGNISGNRRVVVTTEERAATPETPTTPLHPFTRTYADRARSALITSYNRTRIPVADIEFRKAFRYIFITRPECYLMAIGDQPSIQVLNDEDMSACWARYPHVLRALSPVYVTSTTTIPKYANWNWLLCNRVQGLTTGGTTLNLVDSMTKSVRGATVIPGKNITTMNGATLDLSFRDTKYFDVYEMLRIWMLYIHKRRTGSFFPSYNGYHLQNNFITSPSHVDKLTVSSHMYNGYSYLHPYDRALDYCASLYDIVTNETGTKILYWCKYYGIYPVNISNGALANDANMPLTGEAKITATFQYQYKRENIFKNLVEFNFNAGICDNIGNMREDVSQYLRNSLAYLNRENGEGGTSYTNDALQNYAGASSMFTGSPYIATEYSGSYDPWDWHAGNKMISAKLQFIPLFYGQENMNASMNLGITNEAIPTSATRQTMVLQANRT